MELMEIDMIRNDMSQIESDICWIIGAYSQTNNMKLNKKTNENNVKSKS